MAVAITLNKALSTFEKTIYNIFIHKLQNNTAWKFACLLHVLATVAESNKLLIKIILHMAQTAAKADNAYFK